MDWTPLAIDKYIDEEVAKQKAHHDQYNQLGRAGGHTSSRWMICEASSCNRVRENLMHTLAMARAYQMTSLTMLCEQLTGESYGDA